jgi:thymidylate synthase
MVRHFVGQTCDEVWRLAASRLSTGADAIRAASRLGPTLEYLHCVFEVTDPRQRWVLSRTPALNPAFAIAETLWILTGSQTASSINFWNPRLPNFAGHGETYYGAYGHRLRAQFGLDQIDRACEVLSANRESRQVVLQIWDAERDLPRPDGSPRDADIPCNVCAILKVRDGALHWTQVLRSNDIYLGTPHNFVQFTTMQELLSECIGVEPGTYVHIADSLHMYEKDAMLYGVAATGIELRNTDRLGLSRPQLADTLLNVSELMSELTSGNLVPAAIRRMLAERALPSAWRNLLCVLIADAARRRNWRPEMQAGIAECTNPVLRLSWAAWQKRVAL